MSLVGHEETAMGWLSRDSDSPVRSDPRGNHPDQKALDELQRHLMAVRAAEVLLGLPYTSKGSSNPHQAKSSTTTSSLSSKHSYRAKGSEGSVTERRRSRREHHNNPSAGGDQFVRGSVDLSTFLPPDEPSTGGFFPPFNALLPSLFVDVII